MGIQQNEIPAHWKYFSFLEDDVTKLSRWIEFHRDNYSCYSMELAHLLMAASSEVDVVAKMLCRSIDSSSTASSINAYQRVIIGAFSKLPLIEIDMPLYGLTLTPWSEWNEGESPPIWWQANNKVKHHRSEQFHQANLKNALNSVAGLYLLLVLFYGRQQQTIEPSSKLFGSTIFAHRDGPLTILYPDMLR